MYNTQYTSNIHASVWYDVLLGRTRARAFPFYLFVFFSFFLSFIRLICCCFIFRSFNFVLLRLLHSTVPEITTDVSMPSIELLLLYKSMFAFVHSLSHYFKFSFHCVERRQTQQHYGASTYKSVSVCSNFHK